MQSGITCKLCSISVKRHAHRLVWRLSVLCWSLASLLDSGWGCVANLTLPVQGKHWEGYWAWAEKSRKSRSDGRWCRCSAMYHQVCNTTTTWFACKSCMCIWQVDCLPAQMLLLLSSVADISKHGALCMIERFCCQLQGTLWRGNQICQAKCKWCSHS